MELEAPLPCPMLLPQHERLHTERCRDGVHERQEFCAFSPEPESIMQTGIWRIGLMRRGAFGFKGRGVFIKRNRTQVMSDQANAKKLRTNVGAFERRTTLAQEARGAADPAR